MLVHVAALCFWLMAQAGAFAPGHELGQGHGVHLRGRPAKYQRDVGHGVFDQVGVAAAWALADLGSKKSSTLLASSIKSAGARR